MAFFICFCKHKVVPWVLRENNALQLANQSARYIGYRNKPYNKIYTSTIQVPMHICKHALFLLKRYEFTNLGMPAGSKDELKRVIPQQNTMKYSGIPIFRTS